MPNSAQNVANLNKGNFLVNSLQIFNSPTNVRSLSENLTYSLLISIFIFVNFIASLLVIQLPIFSNIALDLYEVAGIIFGVAGFVGCTFFARHLYLKAYQDLNAKNLSFYSILSIILVFVVAVSLWWLVLDPEEFFNSLSCEFMISSLFLVNSLALARELFVHWLDNHIDLNLKNWVPLTRKVKSLNSDSSLQPESQIIPLSQVALGDLLFFTNGDIVGNDCIVQQGYADVAERSLTLKASRRRKQAQDVLYAGSKIITGKLIAKVEALPEESRIMTFADYSKCKQEKGSLIPIIFAFACFFLASFFSVYWYRNGLLEDYSESVFGSFLVLALLSEWYQIKDYVANIQLIRLMYQGIIVKNIAALKSLISLEKLIVHCENAENIAPSSHVSRIEIVDDRIEPNGFHEVLYAICSKISGNQTQAILQFLTGNLAEAKTEISISNLQSFPERGFYGEVHGVEFTVGSEDLLIERGVLLNSNDVAHSENEQIIFVAMDTHLIAKIIIKESQSEPTFNYGNLAISANVDLVLSGQMPQKELDQIGQAEKIELSKIYGEEDYTDLNNRASKSPHSAIYLADIRSTKKISKDILKISPLDKLLFDIADADVILVDSSLHSLLSFLPKLKRMRLFAKTSDIVLVIAAILLAIPASIGLVPTEVMLSLVFMVLFAMGLSLSAFVPSPHKGF